VAELLPDDLPAYIELGPFSYADPALIEHDLTAPMSQLRKSCRTASQLIPQGRRDIIAARLLLRVYRNPLKRLVWLLKTGSLP
jgi:hypothetical protein